MKLSLIYVGQALSKCSFFQERIDVAPITSNSLVMLHLSLRSFSHSGQAAPSGPGLAQGDLPICSHLPPPAISRAFLLYLPASGLRKAPLGAAGTPAQTLTFLG